MPLASGLAAYKALVSLGTRPTFRALRDVGHGVSRDMMGLLRSFLLSAAGPQWPFGLGGVGVPHDWVQEDVRRHLESLSVSEIMDFLHARNIDTSR